MSDHHSHDPHLHLLHTLSKVVLGTQSHADLQAAHEASVKAHEHAKEHARHPEEQAHKPATA
jgi:hypothetical protein